MPVYNTDVIVFKGFNYGDADKILTLYSRDAGKIRAIAKGIRRPKSRLASGLQPFTYSRLQLWRGRNLDGVRQVEVRRGFTQLRQNLNCLAAATCIIDLTDTVMQDGDRQKGLFELIVTVFRGLESGLHPLFARLFFEVRFLRLAGFQPELERCVHCRAGDQRTWFFSPALGGIVCEHCRLALDNGTGAGLRITEQTLQLAQRLMKVHPRRLFDLQPAAQTPAPQTLRQLHRLLRSYEQWLLDRRLASWKFLDLVTADLSI